jgi:DNA-binding XRE family transcriptional regulator
MKIGEYFKQKRLDKGLTTVQLAKLISDNFQESLFWDFEGFDDNDIDGWSISDFKRYCEILGINPTDFADIPISNLSHLTLPILVKTRREEKNISVEDLSESIGYYPEVIEAIENDRKDVVVCLDVLKAIARELDIPFRVLLEKI